MTKVMIRRIVGTSMLPRLMPGKIILALSGVRRLRPGQVVIVEQDGKEKIKRIERVNRQTGELFVIGDNLSQSTDSRHFGWLPRRAVQGRVFWPRQIHNG